MVTAVYAETLEEILDMMWLNPQQPKLQMISNLLCQRQVLQVLDRVKEEKQRNRIHGICEERIRYVGTNFPFSYTRQLK